MLVTVPAAAAANSIAMPSFAGDRSADPIYAAIERCRVAEAANMIEPPPSAVQDIRPAREALARTRPTTPAGLAALTTFVRDQTAKFGEFYFEDSGACAEAAVFISSLDDAVRGVAGLQPWTGIAADVDPIFAAIERHREAYSAFDTALNRKSTLEAKHSDLRFEKFPGILLGIKREVVPGVAVPLSIRTQKDVAAIVRVVAKESKPRLKAAELRKMETDLRARLRKEGAEYKKARRSVGLAAADRAEHETSKAEMAAANVLLTCRPTTRAGLTAFLAYVTEFQEGRFDGDEMFEALRTATASAKMLD